jgi:CBS domain-containing protein
MQLQDVITRNPETISPDDSIRHATKIMRDCQIGFLPVTDDERVLGVVTDRDIVIRAIASGFDPQTTCVRHVMTKDPVQLQATDPIEKALEIMARWAIARVIVTDSDGRIVGVLTSGDAATACKGDDRAGQLTAAIHRRANKTQPVPMPPPNAQFVSE